MAGIRRYKQEKLIFKISVDSHFTFSSFAWLCVFHCSHAWTTVLNKVLCTRLSVKIALISYWNYFSPRGELQKYAKKSNFQMTEDMLSKSPWCNDTVADLHFPRFFGTHIQCEIARSFPRSVVKVGLNVQCKNINILSGVQPWTSTDLKLSYFNT